MVHESDRLKKLSKILEPDSRILMLSRIPPEKLLEDFHKDIDRIKLFDFVDENVVREFEKAKNILLYSFYSYSVSSVALLHAYSCVEKAITVKAQKLLVSTDDRKNKNEELLKMTASLWPRINFALDRKWVGKKHFYKFDSDEDLIDKEVFRQYLDLWVNFRNSLSHNPSFLTILWQLPDNLQIFANIINAISVGDSVFNESIPEINLPKAPTRNHSAILSILMGQKDLLTFKPFKK